MARECRCVVTMDTLRGYKRFPVRTYECPDHGVDLVLTDVGKVLRLAWRDHGIPADAPTRVVEADDPDDVPDPHPLRSSFVTASGRWLVVEPHPLGDLRLDDAVLGAVLMMDPGPRRDPDEEREWDPFVVYHRRTLQERRQVADQLGIPRQGNVILYRSLADWERFARAMSPAWEESYWRAEREYRAADRQALREAARAHAP